MFILLLPMQIRWRSCSLKTNFSCEWCRNVFFTVSMTLYTLRIYHQQCHCFVAPHMQLKRRFWVRLFTQCQYSEFLVVCCITIEYMHVRLFVRGKHLFFVEYFSFLLACLNWFENNHWNTSVHHLQEVNLQFVLLFFGGCLFRWTDLFDRYLFIVQTWLMHLKLLSSVQPVWQQSAAIWPPSRLL